MSSPNATSTAPAPAPVAGAMQAYRVLLAWAVVLVLVGIANQSRVGHTAIYYLLVLALFLLIVTQYRWFASVLAPITGQGG